MTNMMIMAMTTMMTKMSMVTMTTMMMMDILTMMTMTTMTYMMIMTMMTITTMMSPASMMIILTSHEPTKPRHIPNRSYRMFFKVSKNIATVFLRYFCSNFSLFLDL